MSDLALDPRRTALLFFDMLKGANFVRTPGLLDNAARVMRAARATSIPVFYAVAQHRADHRDHPTIVTDADMNLNPWPGGPRLSEPPGVKVGTPEAQVVDELAPQPGDWIVPKPRWSAFFGTPLDSNLRSLGVTTILLSGGSTDVGIVSTAYAARDLDYNLVILRDCCMTLRPGAQDFLMDRIFPRMARVMTADQAVALLEQARATR